MTLQDLANYGEILGAAGVIASLIFVGWQIRSNTRAARLRMHEQVTQTYMSFLGSILVDPGSFAAGLKSDKADFADLNDAQKAFFFATMLGFFKHFEMMYVQYSQGVMDEETWNAWSTHIRMQFHQPGAQRWWNLRKETFIPAFREYLDSSTPPTMHRFVDLLEKQGTPQR
jgi:hypothetical protein